LIKYPGNGFAETTIYGRRNNQSNRQFDQLEATVLFCPHCKEAVPVRKKLLLALSEGDKYDYLCVSCGNSVGTKIERCEALMKVLL